MKSLITLVRRMLLIAIFWDIALWAPKAFAQTSGTIWIVELRGTVEVLPRGATSWVLTQTNQILNPLDRVRTGTNSSVGLLWSDQSVLRFDALTEMEILSPDADGADHGLHLLRGLLSFFHRDQPSRIRVITSGALAGIEGTEFVMTVIPTNGVEQTTLSVIDGKVRFGNAAATLLLTNDEQAIAAPGQAPLRTSGFLANNILQWCFYYPGVLDLNDLRFTAGENEALNASLVAYRAGDLLVALAKYPPARQRGSDAEQIYHAALLLNAGQVAAAEADLTKITATDISGTPARLANALRTLIAAVKREPRPVILNDQLASEFLAASYYAQAEAGPQSLDTALRLARRAVTNSPAFGFGWERVAELEFSFGRTDRALAALDQSLRLAPRNPQALALKGFLLAAQNRTREAGEWFDHALAADSALGNAWLGRGLCRIRRGDVKAGREDLLIAAAMEPQRAALRSYLGKAFGDAGDSPRATHEFYLAEQLDPKDPTAWLYSALLNEQSHQINDAIRDLEKSQQLNNNRSVYRSGLLLDQDRAVRSANLARIYQEAGMEEVAVREATRAVSADYANYSAHLFLANSYNALRDPNQINLRYETPTYVEFLVGNLLAPVNAGVLSPAISQQEYSRLFERDRFGVISESEYLSRGAWTQSGAQYGTEGNFSYDFEAFYRTDPGQRANNDIEQRQLSLAIKQQLTPQDTLFGNVLQYEASGGDLRQYFYQTEADSGLRTREHQDPLLVLGYHHEWSPGAHTLFLGGRLQDTYQVQDSQSPVEGVSQLFGPIQGVEITSANQNYRSEALIYTTELQQIWQRDENAVIGGVRFQNGNIQTHNFLNQPQDPFVFPGPPFELDQSFSERFERFGAYGYYFWRALDSVQLTGGLSYDWMTFPQDFRLSPITGGRQTENQFSPKGGIVWTPFQNTVLRAAYTRSLGGASLEQSFQLEPAQVAGFNQLYRSLIPESIAGENAGARFETWNLALEQKIGQNTYLGLSGQLLNSTVDRQSGIIVDGLTFFPSATPEHLDFSERSFQATLDQLLGKRWAVGLRYQLTNAKLIDEFTQIPSTLQPVQNTSALLHQLEAHARFNHSSGCFAQFQALWTDQHNAGYSNPEPGENFWQLNILAGYRSPRNHAEVTIGVLNLAGHDYTLNPLTSFNELPRSRTLLVRLKLDF